MKADGRVVIDTALDNKGFNKGVKSLGKDMNGLNNVAGKLAKTMAAAFSVKAVLDFGRACVEVGSDIAEVQNVVDVSFGAMKQKAEDFADTAIETFGMSKLSAKKTASTYMAMARGMGLAEDVASDMAITLAGMTGDVASFYNISQELADIKLKSVFTGETESLKDLGVVMTQANLQQYAMTHGMGSNISTMSQAEQVMLRYSFVMDALSLAQGDFLRTQDSWANQIRILSMQWQEFMGIIGQGLTQILLPLVQLLNHIVGALISAGNAIKSLFGAEAEQAEQGTVAIGGAVDNQKALTKAVKDTTKAQKGALAGFDQIQKLGSGVGGPGAAGGEGVPSAVPVIAPGGISKSASKGMGEAEDTLGKILHFIELIGAGLLAWHFGGPGFLGKAKMFVGILLAVKAGIRACKDAMDIWNEGANESNVKKLFMDLFVMVGGLLIAFGPVGAAIGLVVGAVTTLVVGIKDVITNGWNLHNMMLVIGGLIMGGLGIGILTGSFIPMLIGGIAAILVALTVMTGHGDELISGLKEAFGGLVKFVSGVFTGDMGMAIEGLGQMLDGLGGIVHAIIGGIEDTFLGFLDWLDEKTGGRLGPIIEGVKLLFQSVHESVDSVVGGIKEILGGVVKFVSGVFSGDWDEAWEGVKEIFSGIWNGMIGVVESALNFFVRGINKLINAINEKLCWEAPDWVPLIGGKEFSITVPTIPEVALPRLAQGAVIPPNREFMAVLGDQKSGTNIEAPLDTIIAAMKAALGDMGGQQEAVMMLDDDVVGKLIYKLYNRQNRIIGVTIGGTT